MNNSNIREYIKNSKENAKMVYDKLIFLHFLFPNKWFHKKLEQVWGVKPSGIEDGFDQETGGIRIKSGFVVQPPHPFFPFLYDSERIAQVLDFSFQDFSPVNKSEDFTFVKRRLFEEMENRNYTLVSKMRVLNVINRISYLGNIVDFLQKLNSDSNFSHKVPKYQNSLHKDSSNFYQIISELLVLEKFHSAGLLQGIEMNLTGKNKPDFIFNLDGICFEGEVFSPNPIIANKTDEEGRGLQFPQWGNIQESYRKILLKLIDKLNEDQFSSIYPGILFFIAPFPSINYLELVPILKDIFNTPDLYQSLFIPESLELIITSNLSYGYNYIHIPNSKRFIDKTTVDKIIQVLKNNYYQVNQTEIL